MKATNTALLLSKASAALGVSSDYALAKGLGVPRQTISRYRNGKSLPDRDICYRIADLVGLDRAEVYALVGEDRAIDPAEKEMWHRIASTMHRAAAFVVVIVVAVASQAGMSGPAEASEVGPASKSVYYVK